MSTAAQGAAQVVGQRADVRARAARYIKLQRDAIERQHVQGVNRYRARLKLDVFAAAGPFVGGHAVAFDGRVGGRGLHDLAAKGSQRLFQIIGREGGDGASGRHVTFGIVGVGGRSQRDFSLIRLRLAGQVLQQAGRLAEAQHQHAGRHGVEGAGVADLANARQAARLGHHVMGCPTGWLVDDQHAGRAVAGGH